MPGQGTRDTNFALGSAKFSKESQIRDTILTKNTVLPNYVILWKNLEHTKTPLED